MLTSRISQKLMDKVTIEYRYIGTTINDLE